MTTEFNTGQVGYNISASKSVKVLEQEKQNSV